MTAVERLEDFLDHVQHKPSLHCLLEQQAVKRYIRTRKKKSTLYKPERLNQVVEFLEKFVYFKDGRKRGIRLLLEPFQIFYLAAHYTLFDADTKERLVAFSYFAVPRKSAKTQLLCYAILVEMFLFPQFSWQGYCIANTQKQAYLVFNNLRAILRSSPLFRSYIDSGEVEILADKIQIKEREITFQVLAAESSNLDGLNPDFVAHDEFHEQTTGDLYTVIRDSFGNKPNQLYCIVTTAGFHTNGFAFAHEQYVRNVISGKEENDKLFGLIYSPDPDDDIHSEKTWLKVNPLMGIAQDLKTFRAIYNESKSDPAKFISFCVKRLNIYTTGSGRWLSPEEIKTSFQPIDRKSLEGCEAYASIDIGTVDDLFCRCLAFHSGDKIKVLFDIYIAENSIEHRQQMENVHWKKWIKEGFVHITPGRVVNEDIALKDLIVDASNYHITEIAYDPWSAAAFIEKVSSRLKIKAWVTRQGVMLTPHIKTFREFLLDGKIILEDNPVAKWCFGNAVLQVNGKSLKITKGADASQKIDPLIAAVMAVYRANCHEVGEDEIDWSKFTI